MNTAQKSPAKSPQKKASSSNDIPVVSGFTHGYRNREDVTLLAPGTLVVGSFNVLSNVSGRIGLRKGYSLDGASSSVVAPILSSFDWPTHVGPTRHLRAGFLTSAANDGKLQFRFVSSTGVVTWYDLMTGLTSSSFNFCDYWDSTQLQAYLLMVNNTPNIYEWSGGVTTFASATATTITKQGTNTWVQDGFYNSGTRTIIVNGVSATYSGGDSTTTLTGVSVDFSATAVGTPVYQAVRTTANSAMTALPTINNALIANLRNQIYIGSLTSNNAYVSKVNNYKDYSFTTPTRVVGEGALLTLDGTSTAFIPQEDYMTLFAGKDQVYQTKFTLSSDLTKEDFAVSRLKTTSLQSAQSQALATKIKNDILFLSNEPIINTLGRVDNVVLTPQITDISFPIVNDMNAYDFTNASLFYTKQYAYLAVPAMAIVRVYNMTNPKNPYWEAPLLMPISRFSDIDGVLYGHSYQTSESYKLFDGLTDKGNPYDAAAVFAFENSGIRSKTKSCSRFWVEGYISPSTTLNAGLQYNQDGCATITSYPVIGTDDTVVCSPMDDNALGKFALGKNPLGGNGTAQSASALPPRFNVIKSFPRTSYFNVQPSFSSSGINQQWELLGYGTNATLTSEGEPTIVQ